MYDYIENIINDWDPIDLFPLAPKDEYKNEVKLITDIAENNRNISVSELSKEIKKIFINSFGEDMLFKDNVTEIANEILKVNHEQKKI